MPETHSIDQEELMAYFDGELPAARATEVATHLEHCIDCRQFAGDLRSLSRHAASWQVEPLPTQMPARLADALDSQAPSPAHWRHFRWPRATSWALGATALGVLALSLVSPRLLPRLEPRSQSTSFLIAPPGQAAEAERGIGPVAPLLVSKASLALIAADLERARASMQAIVRKHDGMIASLTVNASSGAARTADAILRVPAAQLEAVMAELKALGRVQSESVGAEEVTSQYIDLEARLTNARNTEKRLTDLLADRTGKLSDVLAVEQEISRVRGQIERMMAERKQLLSQVAMATLNVSIAEVAVPQWLGSSGPILMRFRSAALNGLYRVVNGFIDLLELLLAYGPALLVWALVLFFPARFAWKRLRLGAPTTRRN